MMGKFSSAFISADLCLLFGEVSVCIFFAFLHLLLTY